ncbi:hypothetical protein ACJMK2_033776 [Sinanodonta woodiana]|uniref:Uncharacterized protein n=1 Tax=Sinanodonta woodiana TaxID=1069815 RepID=A0ABD3WPF6_SINWO
MGNSQPWAVKNSFLSRLELPRFTPGKKDEHAPYRIISKDGKVQIGLQQMSFFKRRRYWKNILTTVLQLKWRWMFVIFSLGFLVTWTAFAIIYYIIALVHGDIGDNYTGSKRCIAQVGSFTAAFLFSLETQHTIGYGFRHVTTECGMAVLFVFLQFILGIGVQCVIAGLVVAKLQLARRCGKTVLFSSKLCVGTYDGEICLMVRVGNTRQCNLVSVKGYGVLMERATIEGNEGQDILSETSLDFTSENGGEYINLFWPAVMYCVIANNPQKFVGRLFDGGSELVITLEGIIESTGQNLQVRTSYKPHEIELGKKFCDLVPRYIHNNAQKSYHVIDHKDFHLTENDPNWTQSFEQY